MRTFRLATSADIPALVELVKAANQPEPALPNLAIVAEEDGRLIAAIGLELSHPGMVVCSGGVMHPDYFRNRELATQIGDFTDNWLRQHNCFAYIFSVSKRNTRMMRFMEKRGARRYAKKHGAYWYVQVLSNPDLAPAAVNEEAHE